MRTIGAARRGDVVFFKPDLLISPEDAQQLRAAADQATEGTGVRIVFIGGCTEAAFRPPTRFRAARGHTPRWTRR